MMGMGPDTQAFVFVCLHRISRKQRGEAKHVRMLLAASSSLHSLSTVHCTSTLSAHVPTHTTHIYTYDTRILRHTD